MIAKFLKRFLNWFPKLFSSSTEASSKRFVCIFLVLVYVIWWLLVTFLKIEIPNKDLVNSAQHSVILLIMVFGGFITYENYLSSKSKTEQP